MFITKNFNVYMYLNFAKTRNSCSVSNAGLVSSVYMIMDPDDNFWFG